MAIIQLGYTNREDLFPPGSLIQVVRNVPVGVNSEISDRRDSIPKGASAMRTRVFIWLGLVWFGSVIIGIVAANTQATGSSDNGTFPEVQYGYGDRAGIGNPDIPQDSLDSFGCGIRLRCVTWEEIDPPFVLQCNQCWYSCVGPIWACQDIQGRAVADTGETATLLDSVISSLGGQ